MQFLRGFDVDDTVVCMGMHPVKTTAITGDTDILRYRYAFAVDVDRKVYMNVIGALPRVTVDAIDRWVGGIRVKGCLQAQEDKAHEC